MPDTWFDRTHSTKRTGKKSGSSFVSDAVKRVPNRELEPRSDVSDHVARLGRSRSMSPRSTKPKSKVATYGEDWIRDIVSDSKHKHLPRLFAINSMPSEGERTEQSRRERRGKREG